VFHFVEVFVFSLRRTLLYCIVTHAALSNLLALAKIYQ